MGALARDEPVIPGVIFLSPIGPHQWGLGRIAKPSFRFWIPCFGGSSQAGFWLCPLRWVSVPSEPTFGPPRFLFKGVPPQPNCPPAVVPETFVSGKRCSHQRAVFHCRLRQSPKRTGLNGSRLHYAKAATSQQQAAVKLHGVFFSRWEIPDCSSESCGFTGLQAGTVGSSLIHSCTSELTRQGIWLP